MITIAKIMYLNLTSAKNRSTNRKLNPKTDVRKAKIAEKISTQQNNAAAGWI